MDANATKRRPSKGARIYHGIVRIAGGCMLGYLALFFLPAGPWTNLYCPVSAKAKTWGDVPRNQYIWTKSWLSVDDDYVVHEGRLFLRVQSTRPSIVTIWLDEPRWDTSAITDLIKTHRDLRARLPNPDAANGGIEWIRR